MTASAPLATLEGQLARALELRLPLIDADHKVAVRLLNGFYESSPELVGDLYGRTLVLFNYADPPEAGMEAIKIAAAFYTHQLPWLDCILLKNRRAADAVGRQGTVLRGSVPEQQIEEYGVRYALDLTINQDASFYLDTRLLRGWLLENMTAKTILNTFAYTGSLGVAARAGGARRVVFTDLNRRFLNLAKQSYALNGFQIEKGDFVTSDFFPYASRLKRSGALFDCVILDPPIHATTSKGTVDMLNSSKRLINKVRPLVQDGGYLIVINNALFLPGADYLATVDSLCQDGYLTLESLIPIPQDCTGFLQTIIRQPPTDPAPFNHPTKIAVLRVRRKSPLVA